MWITAFWDFPFMFSHLRKISQQNIWSLISSAVRESGVIFRRTGFNSREADNLENQWKFGCCANMLWLGCILYLIPIFLGCWAHLVLCGPYLGKIKCKNWKRQKENDQQVVFRKIRKGKLGFRSCCMNHHDADIGAMIWDILISGGIPSRIRGGGGATNLTNISPNSQMIFHWPCHAFRPSVIFLGPHCFGPSILLGP